MICPNCGNEVKDGAKFCTKCGSGIVQAAAQIQPQAAQPAGTVCPKCGSALKPGVKFCTKCGTPIQQAAQPQQAAAPVRGEEDRTVFLQENMRDIQQQSQPQPQQQAVYQSYGTVVQTPNYPEQTAEEPEKKEKGGSKGVVIAICLSIALVIALSLTAVVLLTQVLDVDILPSSSSKTASKDKDDEEESSEEESGEEADEFQSVKDLISSGDYETAISTLTDMLSEDDADADEIKSLLQEAVQGKSSSVISQADSYASSGDYDNAYAAIDNALTYFQGYETNNDVYQYVDIQALNDKKSSLQEKQKTALLEEAQKCADNADETGVDNAFAKLEALMDSDELEAIKDQRIAIYSDLVILVVFNKQSAGESATSIMSYIDEHLDETGNNCWVLELWDYNNALNIIETGQGKIESTVKHVSSSGYLLEDSAYKELSVSDLKNLTQYELHLALFEIYARHGRTFNDDAVNTYFSQYSWYKGTVSYENFDDSTLNEYEKYNRDLIVDYERQMGYR